MAREGTRGLLPQGRRHGHAEQLPACGSVGRAFAEPQPFPREPRDEAAALPCRRRSGGPFPQRVPKGRAGPLPPVHQVEPILRAGGRDVEKAALLRHHLLLLPLFERHRATRARHLPERRIRPEPGEDHRGEAPHPVRPQPLRPLPAAAGDPPEDHDRELEPLRPVDRGEAHRVLPLLEVGDLVLLPSLGGLAADLREEEFEGTRAAPFEGPRHLRGFRQVPDDPLPVGNPRRDEIDPRLPVQGREKIRKRRPPPPRGEAGKERHGLAHAGRHRGRVLPVERVDLLVRQAEEDRLHGGVPRRPVGGDVDGGEHHPHVLDLLPQEEPLARRDDVGDPRGRERRAIPRQHFARGVGPVEDGDVPERRGAFDAVAIPDLHRSGDPPDQRGEELRLVHGGVEPVERDGMPLAGIVPVGHRRARRRGRNPPRRRGRGRRGRRASRAGRGGCGSCGSAGRPPPRRRPSPRGTSGTPGCPRGGSRRSTASDPRRRRGAPGPRRPRSPGEPPPAKGPCPGTRPRRCNGTAPPAAARPRGSPREGRSPAAAGP